MEQLRARLQNALASYQRLTQREKRLLALAATAVAAFALFLIFYSFASTAASTRRRTQTKIEDLHQVQQLAASYRQAEQQRQNVERQLGQSNIQLISYLEDKGDSAGLDIRSMNPKGDLPIGDGKIIESSVEVSLTDVPLDKLVKFLSSVEHGPGIVKVKRIRVEPRPQNQTITAWTTISAYSLKK